VKTLHAALVVTFVALRFTLHADEPHLHEHSGAPPQKLGTIRFPVSCSSEAQRRFTRGTALLHSFWYEESEKAYREVLAADSSCGMAWWGLAMTQYHPIWAPPTPAELGKGRDAAERAKEARESMKTDRERDYVDAVAAFYDDSETLDHRTRALRFEKAMERVFRRYPSDHEAAIFYSLALIATAPPSDKSYANQRKAAEILNRVLPDEPDHPGVAHLIIHSDDYPELASLALPAARAYAKIAPSAPHALHMPSHIFTRLGLWDESIASNLASAAAAKAYVDRTRPGAAAFDELHALDYLEYAYLQQSADVKARAVVDRVRAAESFDVPNFAAAYCLAAVPARYALERRDWKEAAALAVRPASFPWAKFPFAEAITHFARAVGAAHLKDVAAAKEALRRLEEIQRGLEAAKDAEGDHGTALDVLRSAADLEDATEKHPVTPGVIIPAREQLGDLLLELGRPADALKEYEAANGKAPNRFNGLAGAARAAAAAGDETKARELNQKLVALCLSAETERPELSVARLALKRKS